jgi:hypothetical protein
VAQDTVTVGVASVAPVPGDVATRSFPKLHRWHPMLPWRDWRLGHQRTRCEPAAREFAAHVDQPPRTDGA